MVDLAARIAGGAVAGVVAEGFWGSVGVAPLWERDREVAGAWRVTFLWRGVPGVTRRVALCGALALGATSAGGGLRFEQIAGTDIWHLTLRVPAGTRSSYSISPNGLLGAAVDADGFLRLQATWVRDPLNPSTFVFPANPVCPEWTPRIVSLLQAPDAAPLRWSIAQPGIAKGRLEQHRRASVILGNERSVWTYTPAGWDPGQRECPLLVAFDGWSAVNVSRLPVVLDNLIAAGAIPPLVAVLVDSGTIEMRGRELDCDEAFVAFLGDELLPWARERWGLVPDRSRTLVTGMSLGGRAAVFAGLRRPDVFGKVIAQAAAVTETGALALDALAPRQPAQASEQLEVYLDVGLLEVDDTGERAFLPGVRRLSKTLRAAGHLVHHTELACGHDDIVYAESIADALTTLLPTAHAHQ